MESTGCYKTKIVMERSDVKIIANYLPQYHRIPENDRFWGDGYTDWEAVKKARPVYAGQIEPRVPLNENYYDLSDPAVVRWQAELAREYGIWGLGIYHYWFSTKQNLLTKPAQNILDNPDIDINYLFIWDNSSWIRTWSNVKGNDWTPLYDDADDSAVEDKGSSEHNGVLAELVYGDKSAWKEHFDYLLPFFQDSRYIKIDGKPVFGFMHAAEDKDLLRAMMKYWDELAVENGFEGLIPLAKSRWPIRRFEYEFHYQPVTVNNLRDLFYFGLSNKLNKKFPHLRRWDYDTAWKNILRYAKKSKNEKTFYSGFVGFDDTPRRGGCAKVITGQSPEKFSQYLGELLQYSANQDKEFVFLTAWNEWGEGAYLEPDEETGYAYLEAVKRALAGK